MVTLQTISTPNKESNNSSSSSDQSSTSPTSPLPPTLIIPPPTTTATATAILLPHQFYQPHYPPLQQQQPMLYYPPTHFYYSTPYPYHYQHQQPEEQFYYPDQFTIPQNTPPPPPPPEVLYSDAVDPCTRGPRNAKGFKGRGFWFGNRNGFGRKRLVTISNPKPGNEMVKKKKWKPKVNPNADNPTESPKKCGGCTELGNSTTIMLRNIPNSLRRGQNLGYAFINFISAEGASTLSTCWNNLGWNDSKKTRAITPAKLQGLAECRSRYQRSVFFCNSEEYLPLEFSPPRNGFNGNTCKAKVIGKWEFRNRSTVPSSPPRFEFRERKTSPKKSGWAKYGTPPRFSRTHSN